MKEYISRKTTDSARPWSDSAQPSRAAAYYDENGLLHRSAQPHFYSRTEERALFQRPFFSGPPGVASPDSRAEKEVRLAKKPLTIAEQAENDSAGFPIKKWQRWYGMRVEAPDSEGEREADAFAEEFTAKGNTPDTVHAQIHARGTTVHASGTKSGFVLDAEQEKRVDSAVNGPGSPLPEAQRKPLERSLGHDLSEVRVHTGHAAEQAAEAIHAKAFTVGHDIVFGEGEYRPGTKDGDHLLAHETAHVTQGRADTISREPQGVSPSSDQQKPEENWLTSFLRQLLGKQENGPKKQITNGKVCTEESYRVAEQLDRTAEMLKTQPNIQKEDQDVLELEATVMRYNGGRPVDFSTGLHIVMLENYFDIDPGKSKDDTKRGAYAIIGKDHFKGWYTVIVDGKKRNEGYGSSHSSITPGHNLNAYRDVMPGEYPIHGEIVDSLHGTYAMRLFRDKHQMEAYYAHGKKGSTVVPAQYTGGARKGELDTQQWILLHWMAGPGLGWSGGLGCQLFQSLKTWLMNTYGNKISTITGTYYLVDIQRPGVFQTLEDKNKSGGG